MEKLKMYMLLLLVLVCALCLTVSGAFAQGQIIIVGQNGVNNLSDAMKQIQPNAGDVNILLSTNVIQNGQVEVPAGIAGLGSVTITSLNGQPVTVSMGGSVLCANGAPLILAQGVTLSNSYLVGGNCLAQPGDVVAQTSSLTIYGYADFVFGGGLAIGSGAKSRVTTAGVTVYGKANRVHGGGYAFNGGQTSTNSVSVNLASGSVVTGNAYAGGLADGQGSTSSVGSAIVQPMGMANYVDIEHGLAQNGGAALVGTQQQVPQIPQPGVPQIQPVPQIPQPGVPQIQPVPQIPQVGTSTLINVGPGGSAANFVDAMNQIPYNAGAVILNVIGNFTQNTEVIVPQNKGITSITVQAGNGIAQITWPEDVGFYACGVPFTLAQGVTFNNGIIYGGCNTSAGYQSIINSTNVTISGTAYKVVAGSKAKGAASMAQVGNSNVYVTGTVTGWIYNGGSALYGGYSSVIGTANLVVQQGARALQSVAGGGFAFGSASQSDVANSTVSVAGTVLYAVYAGGYADQAGYTSISGSALISVEPTGNIGQSVWYGGRAYKNSSSYVAAVSSRIMGRVGATVHQEGRGTDGGVSTIGRIY